MNLIESINSPADLRNLPLEKLPDVADEIREFMLTYVSRSGGHLASSLGAVELAVALHYCFKTPVDKIVWDVGHQAYAHKILTGRREQFKELRQIGGISGFPRISESEYDAVSVGHASTSISAALGLAIGRDMKKENHAVIAVIGDGSLSGGLAFEGLNNLGTLSTDMIIVVNDNKMSISQNVGALSRYLNRVITDKRYNKIKDELWELTGRLPRVGNRIRTLIHDIDEAIKHFVIPGKLFEDMGIRYFGPFDGHNISELVEVFNFIKSHTKGPVLVHTITTKGKGYRFAEDDATKYHGISKFALDTGDVVAAPKTNPSYSDLFGATLVEIGRDRGDVVAITAAMPDGTGLSVFRDEFPNRFFDVGIAEGHAVTFAAGLALKGLKPVVAVYSTFLQRAFDQVVHDVALDGLNVTFCIDRAGIVGEDGPTHHGMLDLSFVRSVPGAVIMAPRSGGELCRMLHTAMAYTKGPVFIRYGRGAVPDDVLDGDRSPIPIPQPETVRNGSGLALLCAGDLFANATAACGLLEKEGLNPTLVNARFVKPLSGEFYQKLFSTHPHVVTLESNTITGGFGSAVLELAAVSKAEHRPKILCLGYPDRFLEHGNTARLLENIGLDPPTVAARIREFLKAK
ncbi:MAG TPA: 1-deoxy-D-xylulose-5-phosphate synthase [Chitinivibrionales bacterium]|nr:1-deoxy-D-xylulose-5-phosphate synthase [Chitinivibrionales bacterium]